MCPGRLEAEHTLSLLFVSIDHEAELTLLVFRRKDLCEAKHDVVCLKFCSKLDNFAGGWGG